MIFFFLSIQQRTIIIHKHQSGVLCGVLTPHWELAPSLLYENTEIKKNYKRLIWSSVTVYEGHPRDGGGGPLM